MPQETLTPFQPLPSHTITPTPTQTFTPTITFTPTLTETAIPSDTPSPTHTSTLIPSATLQGELPEQAMIEGFYGHAQLFSLDCEARSAVDFAAYFGVVIDEIEFLNRLPVSDDPNEGFVGMLDGIRGQIPPESYGVHAEPIAWLLREYGVNAYARTGMVMGDLLQEIASGKPVMVWVVGQVERGTPVIYTPSNGRQTIVAYYEHTVVVVGYDRDYIYVVDPTLNQFYIRTKDRFLESWSVLNTMAVVVE